MKTDAEASFEVGRLHCDIVTPLRSPLLRRRAHQASAQALVPTGIEANTGRFKQNTGIDRRSGQSPPSPSNVGPKVRRGDIWTRNTTMSDFTRTEAEFDAVSCARDELYKDVASRDREIGRLRMQQQQFQQRNRQLRKALENVEWVAGFTAGSTLVLSCPSCLRQRTAAHALGCQTAGVLGRETKE
jgi:hypothetical protein